jgi:Cu-Zn family superoxide dismutase
LFIAYLLRSLKKKSMKKMSILFMAIVLSLGLSCKESKKEGDQISDEIEEAVEIVVEEVEETVISFQMEPKSESNVQGRVTFTEIGGKVAMSATFSGLSPGEHAIHIHEKADCSATDGTSSGGHWNPTAQPHGKWGDDTGFHKGDIGNFLANEDGSAQVNFDTDAWCIGCGDPNKDILGKAVIVHQGIDDFTSQPSGAAGSRISCTGIIQ